MRNFILTGLCLWLVLFSTILTAQPAGESTVTPAQETPLADLNGTTIYHFPAPLDGKDFPFQIVTIDESTPEWAKLLYQPNPDLHRVENGYNEWRKTHPTEKTGHTRNYRKLMGYAAYHHYIGPDGRLDVRGPEEWRARQEKVLKDRNSASLKSATAPAWTLLGPTFMRGTDDEMTDTQINIYSLTQCLSAPNVLYATSEAGATVFKSTDHAATWNSVSDDLIVDMGSRNIEVAPSNPDVVYLCTYHDIYKTTNGGGDWTSVFYNWNSRGEALLIHPTNPDTVMAGGYEGIVRSTDGGATWTVTLEGRWVGDLRYQTGSTSVVYALVENANTNQTEFYKSTDGGATWTIRENGWPNEASSYNRGGQLTTSEASTGLIYAFIGSEWAASPKDRHAKVLRSSDAGESWVTVVDYDNTFGINDGQGYYDWDIEVSDVDTNVVFLGTQGRWVTTDGFQTVNNGVGDLGHADVQEVLFNGDDLWVANDGGIIRFTDETFTSYVSSSVGINAISYWGFDQGWNQDISAATHYHNGTSYTHENYEANLGVSLGGAEPHFALVAHPGDNRVLSKGYGSVNGYVVPDEQGGAFRQFNYDITPNSHNYSGNNVAIDPLSADHHYLGVDNQLRESDNFGKIWNTAYTFPISGEKVWDIELTRANPDAIFVSTIYYYGGNVYRSLDGGATFAEVTLPEQFSTQPDVLNVSVSNSDANTFYVMGHGGGIKIAKTTDGGTTWTDLRTAALNGYKGAKIMQVDGTDGGVYLLTETAVFYRNNTLTDWVLLSDGLPANATFQFIRPFYRDGEVRIATSRGTFSADLYDTPTFSADLVQANVSRTEVNCSLDTLRFDDYSVLNHEGATWAWSFPGASYVSATDVRNPRVLYSADGSYDVTLSVTKNGTTYTRAFENMITVATQCNVVEPTPGNALRLKSATNDYAEVYLDGTVTDAFTFTTWARLDGEQNYYSAFFSNGAWCAHCPEETFGLTIDYYTQSINYRWPGAAGSWWGQTGQTLPKNEWVHVALIVSPTEATVMVNDQVWTVIRDHEAIDLGLLYLGYGNYGQYLNGDLDETTFWKRALSVEEVKELMHLTRDPSNDPDLLAYYQWNEADGEAFNAAGSVSAYGFKDAERVVSTMPAGTGSSVRANEAAGAVVFADAGLTLDFTTQTGAEVVASRIDLAPNMVPDSGVIYGAQYWAVHRYADTDFSADLTFTLAENITAAQANDPASFRLYRRAATADGTWVLAATGSGADAGAKQVTFAGIDTLGQFLIGSGTPCTDTDGDGICDAADSCPELPDNLIGTACDDGDACTTDDVYTDDCGCAGTFADADDDGVCDSEDRCADLDDNLIGTACDDGNTDTENDVFGPDCACAGTPAAACTDAVISSIDFESGLKLWNQGGSDARRSINDAAFASSGSYCVRLRDDTETSVITTDPLDLTDFEELTVDFNYIVSGFNRTEDFWLQISTDGGATFTLVEEWNRGDEFANDVFMSGTATVAGPFSATTLLRFRCDASANNDKVYLDDIVISGCARAANPDVILTSAVPAVTVAPQVVPVAESTVLKVYPNPTADVLNVSYATVSPETTTLELLDQTGRRVRSLRVKTEAGTHGTRLSVRDLPAGLYLLRVAGTDWATTRRVVVR